MDKTCVECGESKAPSKFPNAGKARSGSIYRTKICRRCRDNGARTQSKQYLKSWEHREDVTMANQKKINKLWKTS